MKSRKAGSSKYHNGSMMRGGLETISQWRGSMSVWDSARSDPLHELCCPHVSLIEHTPQQLKLHRACLQGEVPQDSGDHPEVERH